MRGRGRGRGRTMRGGLGKRKRVSARGGDGNNVKAKGGRGRGRGRGRNVRLTGKKRSRNLISMPTPPQSPTTRRSSCQSKEPFFKEPPTKRMRKGNKNHNLKRVCFTNFHPFFL